MYRCVITAGLTLRLTLVFQSRPMTYCSGGVFCSFVECRGLFPVSSVDAYVERRKSLHNCLLSLSLCLSLSLSFSHVVFVSACYYMFRIAPLACPAAFSLTLLHPLHLKPLSGYVTAYHSKRMQGCVKKLFKQLLQSKQKACTSVDATTVSKKEEKKKTDELKPLICHWLYFTYKVLYMLKRAQYEECFFFLGNVIYKTTQVLWYHPEKDPCTLH